MIKQASCCLPSRSLHGCQRWALQAGVGAVPAQDCVQLVVCVPPPSPSKPGGSRGLPAAPCRSLHCQASPNVKAQARQGLG